MDMSEVPEAWLAILAQSALAADVFAAKQGIALLYKRAQRSIALGHDGMRFVQGVAPADAYLASLHELLYFLRGNHAFPLDPNPFAPRCVPLVKYSTGVHVGVKQGTTINWAMRSSGWIQ